MIPSKLVGLFCSAVLLLSCSDNSSQTQIAKEDIKIWLAESPQDRQEREQAAYHREVELIAECMSKEGFHYPYYDEILVAQGDVEQLEADVSADGSLGISTRAFPQSAVGPSLVGIPDDLWAVGPEVDVEEAYLESLTDAEQDAYYRSLHGSGTSDFVWDDELSEEENRELWLDSDSQGGCTAAAYAVVLNEFPILDALAATSQIQVQIEERVETEPAWIEAEIQAWDCVADRGFHFRSHSQILTDLQERLNAVYDHASVGDDNIRIDADGRRILGEIQREERAIAETLAACGADDATLAAKRAEVREAPLRQELGG